ncbi:MAG: hypothetical protein JRN15_01885 [Nitrososphaerota archaeon]|nr:hypothetical protein [Nitrososphaerota archaeon]
MGRGLGHLQRSIIRYLDTKAKNSNIDSGLTVQSYANLQEITTALNESSDAICQALSALIRRGWVKIYPNNRKRDRYYGTAKLPVVTSTEVKNAVSTLLTNN